MARNYTRNSNGQFSSTGKGASIGGKRKTMKQNQSLKIGKRVAEEYNRKVGAKNGTPEANKVGVKAMVTYNQKRRISAAAARSGLGRRSRGTV
jgi:hypothetical protein